MAVLDIECESTIYLNNEAIELFNQTSEAEPLWRILDPPPFKRLDFDQTSSGLEFTEQVYSKTRRKWYQVRSRIIPWHDGRTVCIRMLQDVTDRYDSDRKNKNLLVEIRKLSLRNYNLQEAERKKLSADLHDQLGQLMTGILLQADYVCHQLGDKDQNLSRATKKISYITRELISSVQIITNRLRPVLLDQLGLAEALADLVQEWKDVGDEIEFKSDIDGWVQWIVATQALNLSAGVSYSNVFLGRSFNCLATLFSLLCVCTDKSVPFGKYCRNNLFVFSLLPRCHGLWGSQKYTSISVAKVNR